MGLCGSKSEKNAPMVGTTTTKVKLAKTTITQEKTATKSNSKKTVKTNAHKSKANNQKSSTKAGTVLGSPADDPEASKLTPREAARLAAEKRLADNKEKNTKGALGKKLEQERAKSHKSHLMEQIEGQVLKNG